MIILCGESLVFQQPVRVSGNFTLAQVAKRVPHCVICLLSALRFHGLGTQNPSEVWIAIDRTAARPRVSHLRLQIVKFSGAAFTSGIETHKIEGIDVRVYNPAKTVADCFKYRNKIGLEIAIEALRDCRRSRKCTIEDLWKYAKVCRVANVMRPYLEAIV